VRKLFGVLLVVALVMSFSLVATTPVAASTDRHVPDPYPTIQEAIDAAAAGDTIIVAAGHLAEENIIVGTDDLKLTTDESDPATILYDAGGTTPTIDISAGGVTIENFNIERKGGDAGAQAVIVRRSGVSIQGAAITGPVNTWGVYVEAQNNGHIDLEIVANSFSGLSNSLRVDTGGSARVDMIDNTFDVLGQAVFLRGGTELDVLIDGNEFKGPGDFSTIWVNDLQGESTLWTVDVTHNTFDSFGRGVYLTRGDQLDVLVEDNTFENMTWGGVVVYDIDGPSTAWSVVIDSNRIENNPRGVYLFGRGTLDATVTSNRILDNSDGTQAAGVYVHTLASSDVVTINYNWIEGNSPWGIRNNTSHSVDARWNWWGHASGPYQSAGNPGGKGDGVTANVDFMPWLMEKDGAKTVETNTGYDVNAFASTTNVLAAATWGDATTTVTVGEYVSNPTAVDPGFVFNDVFFFDVHVGGTEPDTLVVTASCPGGECSGMVLMWFDGTEWLEVSPVSYTNGEVVATLDNVDSSPLISELTGTPFGLGNPTPLQLPVTVGWEGSHVNKLWVIAPWLALFAAVIAGAALVAVRRRRAQV